MPSGAPEGRPSLRNPRVGCPNQVSEGGRSKGRSCLSRPDWQARVNLVRCLLSGEMAVAVPCGEFCRAMFLQNAAGGIWNGARAPRRGSATGLTERRGEEGISKILRCAQNAAGKRTTVGTTLRTIQENLQEALSVRGGGVGSCSRT